MRLHIASEKSYPPNDVGSVTTPERDHTLLLVGAGKALANALVGLGETALLDHLVLVLDEKLDTLNGRGSSLGDGSRHTTHHKVAASTKVVRMQLKKRA
jgi:hypothetical protein